MAQPNYYALFGITPDATAEQVRLAFRKAILQHHPDTNGNKASAQEWTILLKDAYDVLSDPAERSRYDAQLRSEQQSAHTPPPRERPNPAPSSPPPRQTPPPAPPPSGGQRQNNARQKEQGQTTAFACSRCSALDETLRVCAFRSVTSLIYFTRTALVQQGIYCAPCRLRLGLKWSLQCSTFGWWGFPFGILWTIAALWNNLRGGVQGRTQNASLLECVGADLLGRGDAGTAILALLKSREMDGSRPEAKRLLAEALLRPYTIRQPRTLWQRVNHLPPSAALAGLLVILCVIVLPFALQGSSASNGAQAASVAPPAALASSAAVPTSDNSPPAPAETAPAPAAPDPVSLPNGMVLKRWPSTAPCRLTVNNRNDRDAIVKLCVGKSLRYALYVRANSTATLYHVEPATYDLKYSVGVDADRQNRRFQGEHDNYRSDTPVTFTIEQAASGGRNYSTNELTLHPVTGGNMPSTPAEDDDFNTDDGSTSPAATKIVDPDTQAEYDELKRRGLLAPGQQYANLGRQLRASGRVVDPTNGEGGRLYTPSTAKNVLLQGEALLYYVYRKSFVQHPALDWQNGRLGPFREMKGPNAGAVYFRKDDAAHTPVWLTVPTEGVQVPASSAERYAPNYRGYLQQAPAIPAGAVTMPVTEFDPSLVDKPVVITPLTPPPAAPMPLQAQFDAPDGATLSIDYTTTPPTQDEMNAAVTAYMAQKAQAQKTLGIVPSAGDVWVNSRSGKYFLPGSAYYGKTRYGFFMPEADATAKGFVAAKG